MADEVVDIRKRIEEMRNEVSAAIVSHQELEDTTYAVGRNADISLGKQTDEPVARAVNDSRGPVDATATSSPANIRVSDDMLISIKALKPP